MRAFKVIQVIASIFSTCIFFTGTVAAQSGGDGRWKAVDYNGSSTFTAVIIVKDGKISEANLSTVCDPNVCKNDTWEESCEVDNFAINKPLTDTSLSCSDWRSMSGSVFGTMTTDGDDKNAGAANLRFLQERDFALFEAEAAKGEGKLSTREFAPRLAELVAKEEKRLADAEAEEKAAKAKKIRMAEEKAAKANAEKKKRNAVNAIKAPVDAKQYIADLRNFFKKHPDKVDAMKLAELFVPAQQDIDSGSFTKKGSNFGKLTVFMSRNKAFAAYRESEIKARAIIMEEQKRLALTKIADGIKTIKLSISKNPLDPNSHSLTKLVKQYEKITGKEPLGTLKSSVLALGTSMTKLGVKPPFAQKVAKTPAALVKKSDSDVATNAPQPKAQKQAEEEAKRAAEERAAARAKEIRMAEERAAHAKAEPKVNLQSERGQYSYQAQKGNEVSNQSSNLAELIMTIIAVIFLLISLVSVVYLARMATKPNVVVYANKIDLLKNVAVTWVPLLGAFMLLIYLEEMGDFAAYSLIFPVLAMAGIGYLVFSTSIKMNESRPMMLVKAGELVEDLNLSQARRRCISIGLAKIVSGFVLGVCSVFLGFMFLGKVNAATDEKTSLQSFAMILAVFAACVGAFTWILRLLINGERVKLCDRILERQLTKDEFSDQAKSGVLDKRSIKLGFEIFENLEIAKARNQEAKS